MRVKLAGVDWRAEIEKKLPLPILEWLSVEEYDLDSEWIKAVETVGKRYENSLRDRKFDREETG